MLGYREADDGAWERDGNDESGSEQGRLESQQLRFLTGGGDASMAGYREVDEGAVAKGRQQGGVVEREGNREAGSNEGTDAAAEACDASRTILVGNLVEDMTEEKMRHYFGKYGTITNSVIMRHITFSDQSAVIKVLNNKHVIDGRTVKVERAREEILLKGLNATENFVNGIPLSRHQGGSPGGTSFGNTSLYSCKRLATAGGKEGEGLIRTLRTPALALPRLSFCALRRKPGTLKSSVPGHNHPLVESCGEKHLWSHRHLDAATNKMVRYLRNNNVSLDKWVLPGTVDRWCKWHVLR